MGEAQAKSLSRSWESGCALDLRKCRVVVVVSVSSVMAVPMEEPGWALTLFLFFVFN